MLLFTRYLTHHCKSWFKNLKFIIQSYRYESKFNWKVPTPEIDMTGCREYFYQTTHFILACDQVTGLLELMYTLQGWLAQRRALLQH